MQVDVTILTDQRYTHLEQSSEYAQNVVKEDVLVMEALKRQGLSVHRCAWDDAGMDWVRTKAALFRSTWDYFDRFEEFKSWFEYHRNSTQWINSPQLIRWNQNKVYLLELSRAGITIPRIVKLEPEQSIQRVMESNHWDRAIVKPFVSGAGRLTFLADSHNPDLIQRAIGPFRDSEDFMVQEYIPSIRERGEVSLIFFGTRYSHAVLKKAKKGDFRVQDDFGGTVELVSVDEDLKQFGKRCIESCPELPVYARVDVMWSEDGQPVLGELEIIEPELWFRLQPRAADLLAQEIIERFSF